MKNKRFTGRAGQHRGQALVEFALAFTIFLLLLLGIVEFGRLLVAYSSVYTAAREAARYGAAVEEIDINDISTPLYNDCGGIRAAANRVGFLGWIDDNTAVVNGTPVEKVSITYDNLEDLNKDGAADTCGSCPCNDGVIPGSRINVTVRTTFRFIVLNLPSIRIESVVHRSILKDVEIIKQPGQP